MPVERSAAPTPKTPAKSNPLLDAAARRALTKSTTKKKPNPARADKENGGNPSTHQRTQPAKVATVPSSSNEPATTAANGSGQSLEDISNQLAELKGTTISMTHLLSKT